MGDGAGPGHGRGHANRSDAAACLPQEQGVGVGRGAGCLVYVGLLPPHHFGAYFQTLSPQGRGVFQGKDGSGWRRCKGAGLCGPAETPEGQHAGGGRAADLVGGDDPLARVLEQLLVSPARVLARQSPRPQVVVAEPEQAQRLQEGLAVPSLRPEGCIRRGGAEEEVSGPPGPRGPPANQPGPPRPPSAPAPPAASPYSPRGPRCPVAGSGAAHMSRGSWASRGKSGSGPDASCPPEKLRNASLQECEEP